MPYTTASVADCYVPGQFATADTPVRSGLRAGCPVERDFYIVPGTGGHGRARADALLKVISAFGCPVAVSGYNSKPTDTFLVMTGTRPSLDALELLLPALAVRMENAARRAAKWYARTVRDALPAQSQAAPRRTLVTSYFRDYMRGYGTGAAETIWSARSRMLEDSVLASKVAEDDARVRARFAREFGQQKPLRAERPGPCHATWAGLAAGRTAIAADNNSYLAVHDLAFAML